MVIAISVHTWPAGMRPGQRARKGTRTPPSKVVPLALAQRPAGAGVVAVGQPRPVVAGVDDQGVLIQTLLLQGAQDLAGRPVDLADDVAVAALLGAAVELGPGVQRHVRHRVRHVEEEGAALHRTGLDEAGSRARSAGG